jgi:hypothetical protein
MSQSVKPQNASLPPGHNPTPATDPYPPYRKVYAWVFQAWLLMFLAVICCALITYLLSYIPR